MKRWGAALAAGAVVATAALAITESLPPRVQASYLNQDAQAAEQAIAPATSLVLANPVLRAELTQAGSGGLVPLIRSEAGSSYLRGVQYVSATAPIPEPSADVRVSLSDGKPRARLVGPDGRENTSGALVTYSLPVISGHEVVGVIVANNSSSGVQRRIDNEIARVDVVVAVGSGAVWAATAWALLRRRRPGADLSLVPVTA